MGKVQSVAEAVVKRHSLMGAYFAFRVADQ